MQCLSIWQLVKDVSSTRVVWNTVSMSKAAGYVIYQAISLSHDIPTDDIAVSTSGFCSVHKQAIPGDQQKCKWKGRQL